jgi:hypothetical protein
MLIFWRKVGKKGKANFSLRICMIPGSGSVTNNPLTLLAKSVATQIYPLPTLPVEQGD